MTALSHSFSEHLHSYSGALVSPHRVCIKPDLSQNLWLYSGIPFPPLCLKGWWEQGTYNSQEHLENGGEGQVTFFRDSFPQPLLGGKVRREQRAALTWWPHLSSLEGPPQPLQGVEGNLDFLASKILVVFFSTTYLVNWYKSLESICLPSKGEFYFTVSLPVHAK